MSGGFRSRLLWALLVIGALTACVAVPSALAQPPYTLAIQNVGSSTNVSCTGSPTMTCVATGDGAVLSTTDLDNDLNGVTDPTVTKVVVGDASTTTTIVVDDPVSGTDPLEFAAAAETTGSVTLQAPTVTFDQGVSGTGALTISGNAVFTGSSDIDSLDVAGTASLSGSISTTTSQTYEDAVSLTGDTTLATTGGTGQVTFDSTVDGGSSLTLTGAAEFDGAVGGTVALTSISASGATTIDADVSTSGSQSYAGATTLGATPLELSGSKVTFASGSTVHGATDLTITGNAEFDGTIGGGTALNSLSVSGNTTLDGALTTSGHQTYTGAVSLTGGSTLTETQNASSVKFDSTVDGAFDLSVSGNAEFDGTIGGGTPLTALSVSGTTTLGASITTTGDQTYTGAMTLTSDSTEAGNLVKFKSTVDGAFDLSVTGNAEFDGTIGGGTPLTTISASGTTTLGASITTTGSQSYNGPATLTSDVTASSTGHPNSGEAIEFMGSIDGAHALTVDTAVGNYIVFKGDIGDVAPLTSLSSGKVILYGNVSTTGDQTYTNEVASGAANDTFSDGPSGSITFDQQILSPSVTMSGAGEMDLLAASTQLSKFVVNAGTVDFASGGLGTGPVTLNGGTLEWATGNTADISPQLTLGSPGGALDTNGNDINFADALSGTGTLTKTGNGTLTLAGSGSYGSTLDVNDGSVIVSSPTITATPIVVNSGGTLNCDDGTLNGGVTNSGGTTTGGPATPVLTSVSAPGSTATVSFTGAANCLPITDVANTTPGGLASNPGAGSPLSVSGLAAGTTYTFTVTATNPIGTTTSGNSLSATTPNPPSVSFSAPANGATFLFNQRVDAHYTCSDSNGPGISSCQSSLASGAALDTSTPGLHSLSVTATSSDGYTSTRTVDYSVAKPLPPVITVVNPVGGSRYTRDQRIVASYSCLDSALGTGIASCLGSAASGSPLATTTLGTHTFTVQATSKDGATAMLTVHYAVVAPPNAFSLAVGARPHGAIRVALGSLHTPGVVKLTIRRPGTTPFSVTRTIKSGSGFTYTLNATAPLRRSLAAAGHPTLKASVSVTYTPHGGSPRTASAKVTLLR